MPNEERQFPQRQQRRMTLPFQHLIEYAQTRHSNLHEARTHHANADLRGGRFFLYLNVFNDSEEIPLVDIDMPWEELLGKSFCPVTSKLHFADDFTVSTEGAQRLHNRIAQLEQFIADNGLSAPAPPLVR